MSHREPGMEGHHIFHERALYTSQSEYKALRGAIGMLALLHTDWHRPVLHKEVPPVPLPPRQVAGRAIRLYEPTMDNLQAIDNMSFAIEEAAHDVSRYDIEVEQSLLCIKGLQLQRPIIKEAQDFYRNLK